MQGHQRICNHILDSHQIRGSTMHGHIVMVRVINDPNSLFFPYSVGYLKHIVHNVAVFLIKPRQLLL